MSPKSWSVVRTILGVLATSLGAIAAENSFPELSPVLQAASVGILSVIHLLPRSGNTIKS